MKCCICKKDIEKHRNDKGEVYWDKGNNALPIKDGRCCDKCNMEVVLPLRIENYRLNNKNETKTKTKRN